MESVIAACIYAACRSYNIPRTLDEIAEASDVERKEIGRTYRFIVRKLKECKKLSDELSLTAFECAKYKRINPKSKLDILNNHKFGSFYNLNKPENCSLTIKKICDMFIHSFIFSPTFDEDKKMKFIGVFINSDYSKSECVYHLDYKTFLKMLSAVIGDEVLSFHSNKPSHGRDKKSKYNKK